LTQFDSFSTSQPGVTELFGLWVGTPMHDRVRVDKKAWRNFMPRAKTAASDVAMQQFLCLGSLLLTFVALQMIAQSKKSGKSYRSSASP